MARNKERKKREICSLKREQLLFNYYKSLAIQVFVWENLPNGIESRYIEEFLFEHTQVAFVNDKNLGFICLPCSNYSGLNIYGEPTKLWVYSLNGKYEKSIEIDDCVRILDNPLVFNIKNYVNHYVTMMNDVQLCKRANLRKQVKPYFVVSTETNRLSVESIVDDYESGEDVVIIDKNLSDDNFDGFKLLTTNVEYIVDKLRVEEKACEYDLLTFLGINNNNLEKKERMLTDEVNSNNEYLMLNLAIRFNQRLRAVEKINEKYGLDVKVSINKDYLSNFIKEDNYGSMVNRIEEN